MIYADGNHVHRMLCLAREAARRFVPRLVRKAAGSQLWRPVVLRWRRTRRVATAAITRRTSIAAKYLTFPQLHFHFATYITQRFDRSVTAVPLTAAHEKPVVLDRRPGVVPPPERPSQVARLYRARLVKPQLVDTKSIVNWTTVRQAPQFQRSKVFAPTNIYHRKAFLIVPGSTEGERPVQKDQPTQGTQTRSRVFRETLRMFSVRRQTISEYPKSHANERKVSEFLLNSPEELVWRRSRRRQLEVVDEPQGLPAPATSVQRQSVRSVPVQESTVAVAHVNPTVAHITKLDPALVDRLAEDVIRRMEQRVRIERQRRGL